MKKYKKIVIILIVTIVIYIVYNLTLQSFYFRPIQLDGLNPSYSNQCKSFYGEPPICSKDSIYFRADTYGFFPKAGIYKISNTFTNGVFLERFSTKSETLSHADFVYNNHLCYSALENTQHGSATLVAIDTGVFGFNSYEKKPLLRITCPNEYIPYRAMILNDELYFNIDSDFEILFRYVNGKSEEVLSEKLVGKKFELVQYYNHYAFLTDKKPTDKNRNLNDICLEKYDLNTKKIVQSFTVPNAQTFDKDIKWETHTITDNYVYFECGYTDTESEYLILRYDIKKQSFDKIFKTKENYLFSVCEDNAFLALKNNGIYSISPQQTEMKKISDSKVNSISILDDKWLYYEGEDYHLYRIMPDGSKTEKVF